MRISRIAEIGGSGMTDNEALTILKCEKEHHMDCSIFGEALSVAVNVFEELEQYRRIGTIEECREAMQKQKPKQPVKHDNCGNKCVSERCPNCFEIVNGKYCENCGQAISWED